MGNPRFLSTGEAAAEMHGSTELARPILILIWRASEEETVDCDAGELCSISIYQP